MTSDWDSVEVFETPLTGALTSKVYDAGNNIKIQCVYDADNIYFLYQIPGKYMFDATNNHCPLSEAVNCDEVTEGCARFAVDIGAHY